MGQAPSNSCGRRAADAQGQGGKEPETEEDRASSPHQQVMSQLNGLQIKEKASLIEAATAMLGAEFEMANKYRIFDQSGNQELFYAVEKTDCLKRQMRRCMGACVPWDVEILYTQGGRSDLAYKLQRPFTMTCCGYNRPVVDVVDVPTGTKLGSIRSPCTCFNMKFDIVDGNGDVGLTADGGCCQWGMWCPLPCGPCSEVSYDVYDTNRRTVGNVNKKVPGCCKWFFAPDVDNYHVDFPGVTEPSNKVLLMALTIFMDFRYFSNNSNDAGFGGDMDMEQQGLLGGQ